MSQVCRKNGSLQKEGKALTEARNLHSQGLARKGQAVLCARMSAKVMSQRVEATAEMVRSGPEHTGNRQLSRELNVMI